MAKAKAVKAQILKDAVVEILDKDKILWPRQREAFERMSEKELFEISDGYFRLPTAFGKTVMFSVLARAFLDKSQKKTKVVILVPRLTLVWQTLEKLNEFVKTKGSVYIGSEKDISADLIVSTYQSAERLFKELDANKKDIGLVLADEAHHALGKQTAKIIGEVARNTPVVGFTATPVFSEEHALGDLLSTEFYTLSIEDCVKDGLLCPVKNVLYRPSVNFNIFDAPIKYCENTDLDYTKLSKKLKIQILIDEIAQLYTSSGDGDRKFFDMRAIINCPNIDIADKQAEKINELAGHKIAIAVHSDQKDFKERVGAFFDNKYQVVCQVNTLTEGLDDPSVELCINYPSCSPVKIEQSGGRVLRQYKEKPDKMAYVLDTVFRTVPDEPLEESLKNAFVAGQVLYRDIAGEFIVTPMDKTPDNKSTTSIQRKPKDSFEIVTDETLLNRLNPHYKAWQRDKDWLIMGFVPRVDPLHDMSPEYIAKKLFNPLTMRRTTAEEVASKLTWMKPSMPYAIRTRLTVNNRRRNYLRDIFYDKFVKNSGFHKITKKTAQDVDAGDLADLYVIKRRDANSLIISMAKQIKAKYKINEKTGKVVLCFKRKYLRLVCEDLFTRIKQINRKGYLGANRLKKYVYVNNTNRINNELMRITCDHDVKHKRQDNFEKLQQGIIEEPIGSHQYKLHESLVDAFCEYMGWAKRKVVQQEPTKSNRVFLSNEEKSTPVWKSETKLERYILDNKNPEPIHEILSNFSRKYIGAVMLSSDYKTLVFNLSYLQLFCDFAGCTPWPIPFKTSVKSNEWKSVSELKRDYIDATSNDILSSLRDFAEMVSLTSDKCIVLTDPETDKEDLYLNVRNIKEFMRFAGFKPKKKADILQHGTQLVESLSELSTVKKEVKKTDSKKK